MWSLPKPAVLALGALLIVSLTGCGDDTPDGAAADAAADAAAETDGAADAADTAAKDSASSDENPADVECDFPDGLSERLGMERQLVLNLAMAEGGNFETVQSAGPPDPETFRSVAEALGTLDLSGITASSQFDEPDDVIADLNETADLLEAALAAGADTADPAWAALAEFYTQEFFARHSSSVGYYLTEAGCV